LDLGKHTMSRIAYGAAAIVAAGVALIAFARAADAQIPAGCG
jgi:hypothetical protein